MKAYLISRRSYFVKKGISYLVKNEERKLSFFSRYASRFTRYGLFLAASLLAPIPHAETIKTATEDYPIQATISQSEPTRIQVLGDRIAQVIHKSGLFSMQENPTAGEIFITPTPGLEKQPINLFVITEQGKTYTLLLTPKDIPASSVVLNPGNTTVAASDWERQAPWQQSVVALLKAMGQGRGLPGYQREALHKKLKLMEGVEFTQVEIYRGAALQGEIYRLKNSCPESITLSETRFYRPGVAAVVLERTQVFPQEEIKILVVVKPSERKATVLAERAS